MIREIISILKKTINKLDFFKVGVTFNFKNREKSSTKLGKIFSFIIFVLLNFTFFSSDLIQRRNPNVLNQQLEIENRPLIVFDETNYTTAFAINDELNINFDIDPTIWSFEVTQRNFKADGSLTKIKNIAFHRCVKNDFLRMPEIYEKLKFNQNTYCLDNKRIEILGFWNEDEVRYFSIAVTKCINNTKNNITCKSPQQIENFFADKYFAVWVEKNNIEIQNYKNPITSSIQIYYDSIDFRFRKTMYLFIQQTKLYTNDGLFFDDINITESFSNGYKEISYAAVREDEIFSFLIYADNKMRYISRNYEKMGGLFAKIGGLANILMIFGYMLAKFETSLIINNKAINELYRFPQNINDSNNDMNGGLLNRYFKKNKKYTNAENSKKQKIEFGLIKYILLFFKRKKKMKEKELIFLKGKNNIDRHLDIIEVLKKLQEIDRLKLILLDESQKFLFDHFSKPLLSSEPSYNINESKIIDRISISKTNDTNGLINHYLLLKNKTKKSIVDRRILEFVGKDLEKKLETQRKTPKENKKLAIIQIF